jgi:transcription elongation factor GreB
VSKAFVKDDGDEADDDSEPAEPQVPGGKNYITRGGYAALQAELSRLLDVERPEVVRTVSWAAGNGDRSENGDYLYGKKRLREIDRRIRFLTRRLDRAEVVDPSAHRGSDQVFFGARVGYRESDGTRRTVQIVGIDELDPLNGRISWISPVARALIKAREGDTVTLATPQGRIDIEIESVDYPDSDIVPPAATGPDASAAPASVPATVPATGAAAPTPGGDHADSVAEGSRRRA